MLINGSQISLEERYNLNKWNVLIKMQMFAN